MKHVSLRDLIKRKRLFEENSRWCIARGPSVRRDSFCAALPSTSHCDERSPIQRTLFHGYSFVVICLVSIYDVTRLKCIAAALVLVVNSIDDPKSERNFERHASLPSPSLCRKFILLLRISSCSFFLYAPSLIIFEIFRWIYSLLFFLRSFSPSPFYFLLVRPFLRLPIIDVTRSDTRERNFNVHGWIALFAWRKKGERKSGREGEKVNFKVFLIGGVSSVAFCREEWHVFSREDIVWRLTHFYYDLSLRASTFWPPFANLSFFSLFARKSRSLFSFLLLPSLSLFYCQKNIKIKLGRGEFLKGVSFLQDKNFKL